MIHHRMALLAALSSMALLAACSDGPPARPCTIDTQGLIPRISGDCTNADLSGQDLDGAMLDGVTWSNTICPDGTNSDDNAGTCSGHLSPAVPPNNTPEPDPEPSPEPTPEPAPEPEPEPEPMDAGTEDADDTPDTDDEDESCPSLNDCGGCGDLIGAPGDPCGPCERDALECDGKEALICDGETRCDLQFATVSVDPGELRMGSPDEERGRRTDESQHRVRITRGFLVKQTEVTQAEWRALMGSNPAFFADCEDCPVERISWYDALFFLNRLSLQDGLDACYTLDGCRGTPGGGCDGQDCLGDYQCTSVEFAGLDCNGWRLPTEAEWEYAARAGTTEATYNGFILRSSCGRADRNLDPIAWYCSNSDDVTKPVSTKEPNAWGLSDPLGNVFEWVWDIYSGPYYGNSPLDDPTGPTEGLGRGVRGGSFNAFAASCRSAARNFFEPITRHYGIGLRPVRTSP